MHINLLKEYSNWQKSIYYSVALVFILSLSMSFTFAEENKTIWSQAKLPEEAKNITLRSIFFLDFYNGWIVGDKGLCLATTDAGKTWLKVSTGSDAILRNVRFNNLKQGFICGDGDSNAPDSTGHMVMGLRPYKSGLVLSTEDGGLTWKKGWVPCNFEIWCVESSAAPILQVGVGCEGHLDGDITRSKDKGKSWQEKRCFRALSDTRAIDSKRWVAVGSPVSVGFTGVNKDPLLLAKNCRALFSTDGGVTWSPSKGSDGANCLRGLFAVKGRPILAVGDMGTIIESLDNGETWQEIPMTQRLNLRSVVSSDGDNAIIAVGEFGRFIFSKDAGKNWQLSWVGQMQNLFSITLCGSTYWSVGANGCAVFCDAKKIMESKSLAIPPEPPKEEVAPIKKATAEQRARIKVGDYAIYINKVKAPELGQNSEYQYKVTVTAINGEEFTQTLEVVKGTPPQGTPQKQEVKGGVAWLEDEFSEYDVGKAKDKKVNEILFKILRDPDIEMNVNNKKLICKKIKSENDIPNNAGHSVINTWLCFSEVPLTGLVKMEIEQTLNMPGGRKVKVFQSDELIEWGHGK